VPLSVGRELGPHLTMPPGARAETYLRTKWHLDPSSRLTTIDMDRNLGWGLLCPFKGGGGAGSLSNTMSPGRRPTSVPSGILIYPTVWPLYHDNTPTSQTDNGPIS